MKPSDEYIVLFLSNLIAAYFPNFTNAEMCVFTRNVYNTSNQMIHIAFIS